MLVYLVLVALFCAVSADECTDHSFAPGVVHEVATKAGVLPMGGSDEDFQTAYNILSQALEASQSAWRTADFYCLDDDNFYEVIDCTGQSICNSAGFIFATVNYERWGNKKTRYYHVASNGYLEAAPFSVRDTEYLCTTRDWFQVGSGWTNFYQFASSGQLGQTYWQHFSSGVIAADRRSAEPCGSCLTGSFPVPYAQSFGVSWSGGEAPDGSKANEGGEIQDMGRYLIEIVKNMTDEVFVEVYVGYDNSYYYGVGDCRHVSQDCDKDYEDGYILYVRNDFYFGDNRMNMFQLDSMGDIVSESPKTGNIFLTKTRPWYQIGSGWSNPTPSATTEVVVRYYSQRFRGGVAASEIAWGDSDYMCNEGRNGVYENDFYCGSERLLLSLSLVVMSVLYALF